MPAFNYETVYDEDADETTEFEVSFNDDDIARVRAAIQLGVLPNWAANVTSVIAHIARCFFEVNDGHVDTHVSLSQEVVPYLVKVRHELLGMDAFLNIFEEPTPRSRLL